MSKKSRVTIKDVAEAAGVGVATASRALNNKQDVRYETRQQVQRIAKQLGYVPNSLARGLLSGSSNKVGVIVTTILNPFYAAVVAGIEAELTANRYITVLHNSNEDAQMELSAAKLLVEQRVDGIVLAPVGSESPTVDFLEKNKVPFVLVGRGVSNRDVDYVICDDRRIGQMATKALIERGHRRILFINSTSNLSAQLRLEGYRQALAEAGLPFDERMVQRVGPDCTVEDAVAEGLRRSPRPTAIFSFCDAMALGVLSVLRERGVRVPEEMALISCDNLDFSAYLSPPLSTIDIPEREMGEKAARALLRRIKGASDPTQTVLQPSLVLRAST